MNGEILFPREYATIAKDTLNLEDHMFLRKEMECLREEHTKLVKSLQDGVESLKEEHQNLVTYLRDINIIRTDVFYSRSWEHKEVRIFHVMAINKVFEERPGNI